MNEKINYLRVYRRHNFSAPALELLARLRWDTFADVVISRALASGEITLGDEETTQFFCVSENDERAFVYTIKRKLVSPPQYEYKGTES